MSPTKENHMSTDEIAARLEELRAELRAERISLGELIELQNLAEYIDPSDVELLEAAGVPEFPDDQPEVGEYIAVDLTENNRPLNPDEPARDLGWGVVRHGHGLQAFGDGYMTRTVAERRAAHLNAGGVGTDVWNRP